MPKNGFLASLLKREIMPPTRTPPTFCPNNQYIRWKAVLAYFTAVLHSQTTHQTHISQKKASSSQILTEPGFPRKFHFSLTRQNSALLRSAYSQQNYLAFSQSPLG